MAGPRQPRRRTAPMCPLPTHGNKGLQSHARFTLTCAWKLPLIRVTTRCGLGSHVRSAGVGLCFARHARFAVLRQWIHASLIARQLVRHALAGERTGCVSRVLFIVQPETAYNSAPTSNANEVACAARCCAEESAREASRLTPIEYGSEN